MLPSMFRAHDALVVIQFAPIRRAADEHDGMPDPQMLRLQNNQFFYHWRTRDEDDGVLYAGIRASLEHLWTGFTKMLEERFDGVAAIQTELAFEYSLPTEEVVKALPQLEKAAGIGAVFQINVRRAIPMIGTFALTVSTNEDGSHTKFRANVVGHPGASTVSDFLAWLDRANETLESNVVALTRRRQDTPYPWTQETPSE